MARHYIAETLQFNASNALIFKASGRRNAAPVGRVGAGMGYVYSLTVGHIGIA